MQSGSSGPIRYRVELVASAQAERRQLAPVPRGRVKEHIRALSRGPFAVPQAKRLDQYDAKWSIPVGELRIVFDVDWDARLITVERIQPRRRVYIGLRQRRRRP